MSGEGNWSENSVVSCSDYVPQSTELAMRQSTSSTVIICIIWICVIFIIAIFIEEVVFVSQKFQSNYRKRKTIYVLTLAPMYALCSVIGVMIPRAGIMTDMVANSYFGMVIYSKMCLVGDYMGTDRIEEGCGIQTINLATVPCCCCCPCLPKPKFNRRNYIRMLMLVYQVTLIRPLISFLSAILWADGKYIPGRIAADNAFPYLVTINTLSTMASIWGLVVLQKTFREELARFLLPLKFLYIQLTLLGTLVGNIVIAALVSEEVIPCTNFIPSGARAQRLDNSFVVVWMVLVSVCGRVAFRRYGDAMEEIERKLADMEGGMGDLQLEVTAGSVDAEHEDASVENTDEGVPLSPEA